MFVLDVDGVVTDPASGAINTTVLDIVAQDLKRGVPAAFNTGRPLNWLEQNIVPPLLDQCTSTEMAKLVLIGEKGGVEAYFHQGQLHARIDSSLVPPLGFRRAARALLNKKQSGWSFSDSMFWYDDKQTMITFGRRLDASLQDFTRARQALVPQIEALLAEHRLANFKIDPTLLSVDVEHVRAGKHAGSRTVLEWLSQEGIAPQSFTAIGDSLSDAAMAEEFATAAPTTFVYVGDPAGFSPPPGSPYQTIITGGHYDRDTAAYLTNHRLE